MAKPKPKSKAQSQPAKQAGWLQSILPSLRVAGLAWLAARIVTIIGGWIGIALIPTADGKLRSPAEFGLIKSFSGWDSAWYLNIVQNGYRWVGLQGGQQNVAYFPLYPLLTKILSWPFPGSAMTIELVLAWAAFFAGLVAFHQLALLESSPEASQAATFFVALVPGALFYFMGYTEALFLVLTVCAFLCARRRAWWISAVFAFFAALTRSTGFLIVAPLAVEWFQQRREAKQPYFSWEALSLVAAPAGLAAFFAYLYLRFHDALVWLHAEQAWHPQMMWFGATLTREFAYIAQNPWWALLPQFNVNVPLTMDFDWAMMLITVALVAAAARRLRWGYLVWAAILLIAPLQTGQSWDMVRYSAAVFPAALAFGYLIKNPRLQTTWFAISASLLTLASAVSVSGRFLS